MSSFLVQFTALISILTLLCGFAFFYFARNSRLFSMMSMSFLLFLMFSAAFHISKAIELPLLATSLFESLMVLSILSFAAAHFELVKRTQAWF